jgi:glyoxylase-like metal-dependent hydrolase (beta-lactamase superfamily II)
VSTPHRNLGHGIWLIDVEERGLVGRTSAYLVRGSQSLLVDPGATLSLPSLLSGLAALEVGQDEVRYVFATHIHLDHAGAAGALMERWPGAVVLCPPGTARHLQDPGRLEQGSRQVFGDRFDRFWGSPRPVQPAQLREVADGEVVDLGGGHRLHFFLTPGHTRRHLCALDEATGDLFSGDTAGLSFQAPGVPLADPYRLPSTPPSDYDHEALAQSLQRLASLRPARILLAHFGPAEDPERLLSSQVDQLHRIMAEARGGPRGWQEIEAHLRELVRRDLVARGVRDPEPVLAGLALDLELNSRGAASFLERAAAS